jgi:N-methylhydantoinase B
MTSAAIKTDPVALEILGNALRSIADEMFVALMKSAYSTNIKERHDHSTAIMDAEGRLIAQAHASLPIHISSMSGLMHHLLGKFGGRIEPGDLFVANDPYEAGGTHLPDVNIALPVFHDGQLIAFVCDIAHHADIGGMVPGSMAGGMSEIYQEGLRIPVVRLFRRGELQTDIMDLLLLNARVPEERRGDYVAQIAAARLGARRLAEVIAHHGAGAVTQAFTDILTVTGARMRAAFSAVPEGVYTFDDVMDDDGMGTRDMPIRLRVTRTGARMIFDFTGSSPQVKGNINVTLNATIATVVYAMKALLDPDVPNTESVIGAVEVVAEPGSIVSSTFPAPVAARMHTCQRIADAVIGALSVALPDRAVAAGNGANTTAVFAGVDPRTGRRYVYLETIGGGSGARAEADGKDGVQVHGTNTSNLPVEAIETEYPLLVEEYSLIVDSGGAGRSRGGMGIRRIVRPVGHDCTFNGAGERFVHRPWGIFGGASGGTGQFVVERADGTGLRLDNKPSGVTVAASERVVVESPGAGGYGPPDARPHDAVLADLREGRVTAAFAASFYRATDPVTGET